jgi:PAS domain S-box-containing protein
MNDKPLNILLIEDHVGDARLIREMLSEVKHSPFDLECVDRLSTGLSRLAAGGVDVVLLDLSLPDSQGFETFVAVRSQVPSAPILVLTGLDDETIAIRAMQEGAQDYLIKGDVTGSMLARAIRYAIERNRVEQAQHFLATASTLLATSLDYETTLDRVACLVVPDHADWCAVHILEADGMIRRLALAHVDPARAAIARERPGRYPLDPNAQHIVPKVVRTGRSELYSEVPDSLLIASARDAEHLKTLRLLGFKSYICVPLMVHGRTFGTITVAVSESGRRYDEHDLALTEELARRAAIAIDNARLYRAAQEEIAERKRAEEAFHTSQKRFRALIENSPDAIALFSAEGAILYGSPATTRILGYTLDEFVGRNAFEFIHPDDHAFVTGQLTEALQRPAIGVDVHARVRHKDGSWRLLEGIFTNLLAEPSVGAIVNNYRDVTERTRAEETLRESEERYRLITENTGDLVMLLDQQGRYTYLSPSCRQVLGYDPAELIGASGFDLVHSEDLAFALEQRPRLVSSGAAQLTCRYRHADGSWRWLEARGTVVTWPGGRYTVAVGRDVTERKQAEAALQRYTERLKHLREIDQSILSSRSLAEIAQAAVVHISHLIPSTRVALVLIDMAAQTVTLFALQVSGEIRVPPGLQAPIQIIGEALEPLKQGQVYQVPDVAALPELQPALRAAQVEHVRAYFYMPIMADTELIAMLNVGSDQPGAFPAEHIDIAREVANQLSIALQQVRLHEQIQRHTRELEQRVIARTAELEAANKELEAFSYSVSHDLRAPLRAIDGFSRILLEDYIADLPDEAQRYLQLVGESTQQMGRLIDDLLAFARLSRQPLNKRSIATADLARQCLEDLHAEQAGRCVEISIGDLPACEGDPALLKQAWLNLIANALKYTRRRDLAVIEIGWRAEGGKTIYYVKDNGVGFDMRYIHKLFGVFQRMHRAEDYEGTGVGLAIVQRIVHRHSGRVWAEAEVDRGATFYFTLGGGAA